MNLDYYQRHGAALFPLPAGSKIPGNAEFWPSAADATRAGSFKHECSRDPEQWERWQSDRPECNFGVVGFASHWIILDIDTKGEEKAAAQTEAWQTWTELCASWGFSEALAPHVQSARGGWHVYFTLPPHIDPATLRQPDAIKKRINVRCIGYTVAAGSFYDGAAKEEESGFYQLYPDAPAPHPAPDALIQHCTRVERTADAVKPGSYDAGDVAKLLEWMGADSFDAYEDWLSIGMALKLEFGYAGQDLWALTHNDSVSPEVVETKWRSFAEIATGNAVTLRSFFDAAHKRGWKGTVRQSAASMFEGVAQLTSAPPTAPAPIGYDMAALPLPQSAEEAAALATKQTEAAHEQDYPTPPGGFLKTSAQFVAAHKPADYVIRPIIQRRFCYAMTAGTGTGKTTIAMRFAAHVAIGKQIDSNVTCKPGTVIYFAGENPDDCRTRWLGLTRDMNLDPDNVDVHFIDGAMHLSKIKERVTAEIAAKSLTPVLIIIDTSMAFFEGEDPNNNREQLEHARRMRSLCALPSGPCVMILCHPVKNATDNNLKPYGGGAFLNEIDGNIFLRKSDKLVGAEADPDKFRGAQFEPINFELHTVWDHPLIVDSDGMPMPTIIARPISAGDAQRQEEKADKDEDKVLKVLCDNTAMKNADVAKAMGWKHHSGSARILKSLADQGLASVTKKLWNATPKGQKYINTVATAQPAEPSYGPLTPSKGVPVPRMYTPPPLSPGAI